MNPLNLLLLAFGGIPGLIATGVRQITKGQVDLTPEGIDAGADRLLTFSEGDVHKACDKLGIKDPNDRDEALRLGRIAGDKEGDFAAFLAKKAAHLQ